MKSEIDVNGKTGIWAEKINRNVCPCCALVGIEWACVAIYCHNSVDWVLAWKASCASLVIATGALCGCRPSEVSDDEYNEFYKSFSKDSEEPMAKSHFTAEGEVTFKSILFVPKTAPIDMFQNYGKRVDHIKMYVRRVFITDNFEDMMPKYLSFVRGVVSFLSSFVPAVLFRICHQIL